MTLKKIRQSLQARATSASLRNISVEDALTMPLEDLDNARKIRTRTLDYYNRTIYGQSYSRSMTLHSCPRKYEISTKFKLRAAMASTTFAYGHAVGSGIQQLISGVPLHRAMLEAILAYDYPLHEAEDEKTIKDGKTLWNALLILQRFHSLYEAGALTYLDGWEVAKFHTDTGVIDGIELTFVIDLGAALDAEGNEVGRRTYEGHIDLVLYNPARCRYLVLELKTTGGHYISAAQYQNSKQALGYGVVLDAIAKNFAATASFDVLYMVVKTKTEEIVPFQFTKTYRDKAEFLLSIQDDADLIDRYESIGYYPQRGESCNDFFNACPFLDCCAESNEVLEGRQIPDTFDTAFFQQMEKPMFYYSLQDLLEIQQKLMQYATPAAGGEIEMLLNIETLI